MRESTKAYLMTALWSSPDDNSEPLDDQYDISDISECTVRQSATDIQEFLALCNHRDVRWWEDGHDLYTLMHDFWLTRNYHAAGFRDDDYSIWEDKLTEIAHMFPEVTLYVGDDDKIYHM